MEKNLENERKSYEKGSLSGNVLENNPMQLFQQWYDIVEESKEVMEVNAMTISTMGLDGFPKGRVVLLKKITSEGFIFYTNYTSEKGKAMEKNPHVCLSFFWPAAEKQVIIKGEAHRVASAESDHYFHSRPRGSQFGAIASPQSQPVPNRKFLEDKLENLKSEYSDRTIKRPAYWGGYLVEPVSMEFWQGRPNRLHDRFEYTRKDGQWGHVRLAP